MQTKADLIPAQEVTATLFSSGISIQIFIKRFTCFTLAYTNLHAEYKVTPIFVNLSHSLEHNYEDSKRSFTFIFTYRISLGN